MDESAEFVRERMVAGEERDAIVADYIAWTDDRMRAQGLSDFAIRQYNAANPLYMSVDGIMRYWQQEAGAQSVQQAGRYRVLLQQLPCFLMPLNPKSLPFISLLALMYGSTLIVSRFSVGQFAPLTLVGLRMLLASFCYVTDLLPPADERAWPRERDVWRHAPMVGIIGTVIPMTLIVSSLAYQSSGVTGAAADGGPGADRAHGPFLAAGRAPNRAQNRGVALAIGGAGALVLLGESGLPDVASANPLGYALVLVAILAASAATIYARRTCANWTPLTCPACACGRRQSSYCLSPSWLAASISAG